MKLFECCCSSKKRIKKNVVLLLVGLDNAGKTTALRSLTGKDLSLKVLPTVGFSAAHLKHPGCNSVTFYDLGGGDSIRDIWPSYFNDVHGVIFAVDCSDRNRLPIAKSVLHSLLIVRSIRAKPLLVIGTKQDVPGAMDDGELAEGLDLEALVNRVKSPARLELTSIDNSRVNPGLNEGYRWLVGQVLRRWEELESRVIKDRERSNLAPLNSPAVTDLPEIEQIGNGKHIALVHSADSGVVSSPIQMLPTNLRGKRSKSAGERPWRNNKILPLSSVKTPSASSIYTMGYSSYSSRAILVQNADVSERW